MVGGGGGFQLLMQNLNLLKSQIPYMAGGGGGSNHKSKPNFSISAGRMGLVMAIFQSQLLNSKSKPNFSISGGGG